MRLPPAPLRFLVAIVGGWALVRGAMLVPIDWMTAEAEPADMAQAVGAPPDATDAPAWVGAPAYPSAFAAAATASGSDPRVVRAGFAPSVPAATARLAPTGFQTLAAPMPQAALPPVAMQPPTAPFLMIPPPLAQPRTDRFAVSGWLFVRDGDRSLAPGAGTLGASQAGLRVTYRFAGTADTPLALSLRLTAALDRPAQSEAAVGLDWQPVRGVPIHILAERRQAIGREGRSDFGVTVYGGGTRRVGPLVAEGYAQAGLIGRDAFADGALRVTRTIGPLDVGAGAWGGAQPGATRADIGPHVSARLPVATATIRAAAEWRFRVAGDAAPASGPAFTLATEF